MNARGSFLIAGLWAMSFFSVVTTSLALNASQQTLLMKRELDDYRSRAAFVSALNYAAERIAADPYPHEDSPADAWFGDISPEARLEDEESKLNLNETPEALLTAFFKNLEKDVSPLRGSRKDYVKGISKLRSVKRIGALEELLLMEGFHESDFEILEPYLTVYPDLPLVNLNTAKPLILKSLLDFLSGDRGTKQIFLSRFEEIRFEQRSFLAADLGPDLFAEKLKLPRTPLMMALVQEFLGRVTLDSETFHLSIRLANGRKAWAVFRYRVGQARPDVLWWRET